MSVRRFALLAWAFALPAAAGAADQKAVEAAVQRGAEFLKQRHAPNPGGYNGGEHGTGTAGLAGLALIEAGVKRDDPALLNMLQFVRTAAVSETRTYQAA